MSASIYDLRSLHAEYTRLSEKFKTLWTFHQFLQSLHKTFFSDAPGYKIDFQGTYEEIRKVTATMQVQPPAVVMESIQRLGGQLDQFHRHIAEDDRKIAPSYVRRFFERVRTEDEKLLLALLRFYFYEKQTTKDGIDKIDFLITLVGARRAIDTGRFLPRFPVELQKLFGGFLALVRRPDPEPAEVSQLVRALATLRREIDECRHFEQLTERKALENVRTLKHRMGPAFYSVDVLSAILETNIAAKNKFQELWEDEEQRILESTRQLLEVEKQLGSDPSRSAGALRLKDEFEKFHQFREDFEKRQSEKGVRYQEVVRLTESIETLLQKLDIPSPGEGAIHPAAFPEPVAPSPPAPDNATVAGFRVTDVTGTPEAVEYEAPGAPATPAPGDDVVSDVASRVTNDPHLLEHVAKILHSVDMLEDGTGSGHAAYDKYLGRLRLEPWEVRAARHVLRDELPNDLALRGREVLFLEAAGLRLRIDDEATNLRQLPTARTSEPGVADLIKSCGVSLGRAQEVDRRFRQALEEIAAAAPAEVVNELNRSRLRLLRAFSGLWLLHNARVM